MYEVELSEAAANDLEDFAVEEVEEIFAFLLSLVDNPKPEGLQTMPMAEAADGIVYLYETEIYSIFYDVFEIGQVVKVVAIFKKLSLN